MWSKGIKFQRYYFPFMERIVKQSSHSRALLSLLYINVFQTTMLRQHLLNHSLKLENSSCIKRHSSKIELFFTFYYNFPSTEVNCHLNIFSKVPDVLLLLDYCLWILLSYCSNGCIYVFPVRMTYGSITGTNICNYPEVVVDPDCTNKLHLGLFVWNFDNLISSFNFSWMLF